MTLFPFSLDATYTVRLQNFIFDIFFSLIRKWVKFIRKTTVKMSDWVHNGSTVQVEYCESVSQTYLLLTYSMVQSPS